MTTKHRSRLWVREWGLIGQAYALRSLLLPEFKLTIEEPKKRKKRVKSKALCKPAEFIRALKKSKKIYPKSRISWAMVGTVLKPGKIGIKDAELLASYLDSCEWVKEQKPAMDIVKQINVWLDRAEAWDASRKKGQPEVDYSSARR